MIADQGASWHSSSVMSRRPTACSRHCSVCRSTLERGGFARSRRSERCGQDDDRSRGFGADRPVVRLGARRRSGRDRIAHIRVRPRWRGTCSRGPIGVRDAVGRGEPHPVDSSDPWTWRCQAGPRRGVHVVSTPRRSTDAGRGDVVRWRATDAGDGASAHRRTESADRRRAVARAGPDDRRPDVSEPREVARGRDRTVGYRAARLPRLGAATR